MEEVGRELVGVVAGVLGATLGKWARPRQGAILIYLFSNRGSNLNLFDAKGQLEKNSPGGVGSWPR